MMAVRAVQRASRLNTGIDLIAAAYRNGICCPRVSLHTADSRAPRSLYTDAYDASSSFRQTLVVTSQAYREKRHVAGRDTAVAVVGEQVGKEAALPRRSVPHIGGPSHLAVDGGMVTTQVAPPEPTASEVRYDARHVQVAANLLVC